MKASEAITHTLGSTQKIMAWFLGDLSDGDLLVRPVPNANHIAWQLGHVIISEIDMGKALPGEVYPELPAGFKEQHAKATASVDPPKGFGTKESYLDLFNKVRGVTIAAVAKLSDADLGKPTTGPMAEWAPTVGALMMLQSEHLLMHVGQFTVVRRKLGKPVVM